MNKKKAYLILEDGTTFQGFSFGAAAPVSGEVVFNTAMTGYPESLTDPSYCGQILVPTFPLIGNYGVPPMTAENGLPKFFESDKIHIKALVISDYSFEFSHWNAEKSLDEWLKEYNVPGIYGVDTRQITKIIRERGVMLGKIEIVDDEDGVNEDKNTSLAFDDPNEENLVAKVSCKEVQVFKADNNSQLSNSHISPKIVLVDCGCKYNIIRCLVNRGATVTCVPWDYDFTTLDYDGLMLGNGPGNPTMCGKTVEHIQKAMEIGKPIFGICLGNQLLSLAAGANTYKLKYGHRSHNQPALEVGTNRAVITSQNHGYAVDTATLGNDWEPYFVNLNDGTNEGIRHKTKPFFSVQFHPEAVSGPNDTEYLFDKFIALCKK
ncbi:MAG: glutamine-hydrolyzing carbamoyl-phosphate synthase small subunit [Bacteroidales bacterium]|jgi:carbamoyl-phosphate synthase small subunit|nr:glutamine-hydrolyzing carbamoyl-phosphate synthase small subunit [Bacteroidales bacterium]